MNLYPAIDVLGGRAVRLRRGRREDVTDYGTPVEMARRWAEAGTRWLHVVDLDGAFAGTGRNREVLREIRREVPDVRIQTGGGIRDLETVSAVLADGADRVVVGTAAVRDPGFIANALGEFPGRVAVGVDARDGIVRLSGWTESASLGVLDLARRLEDSGVDLVIYTDIARDGALSGVDVEATRSLLDATGLRVIASGGVASLRDITRLAEMGHPRLEGAILGKALYEGRVDLAEAFEAVRAG